MGIRSCPTSLYDSAGDWDWCRTTRRPDYEPVCGIGTRKSKWAGGIGSGNDREWLGWRGFVGTGAHTSRCEWRVVRASLQMYFVVNRNKVMMGHISVWDRLTFSQLNWAVQMSRMLRHFWHFKMTRKTKEQTHSRGYIMMQHAYLRVSLVMHSGGKWMNNNGGLC